MDDHHTLSASIAIGGILIIGGIVQLFLRTITVLAEKKGGLRTNFTLKNWSFASIGLAAMLIVIGALLMVGGHLIDDR
jgi:lipoprotein signal peptidase